MPNSNVISFLTIPGGTSRLKFLWLYYDQGAFNVKLDVSEAVPRDLRVFDVYTSNGSTTLHGLLAGKDEKINEVKQKLIHQLK